MQPSDKPEFARLLTGMMAYYRQDVSPFVLDLWWSACEGLSLEQLTKAMNTHAKDPERGQFAPKVADVVRILQGTHTDRSLLAWGKVLDATNGVGAYQDVVFDDPAIHAAVNDVGGWVKLCRTDLKELSYLQHRFCQSHKAYTERGDFDFPRVLSGDRSPDSEYLRRGLPAPTPAVVGDRDKAALVFQGGGNGSKAISFKPLDVLAISRNLEAA
jgi:Domain of unknown function (DUF6475)